MSISSVVPRAHTAKALLKSLKSRSRLLWLCTFSNWLLRDSIRMWYLPAEEEEEAGDEKEEDGGMARV